MVGLNQDVSSLEIANAVLSECFRYEETRRYTSAYDLVQYITMLDAYLDKHGKGSFDHYVYAHDMWMPTIIEQKFYGIDMHAPVTKYIPRAGESKPMTDNPQIRSLAAYVVATFFHWSFAEKSTWIETHCTFEEVSSGYNTYSLHAVNLW